MAPDPDVTTEPTPTAPAAADDVPPHRYTAALAQEIELRWQDFWDDQRHVRGAQPGRPAGRSRRRRGQGPKLFVLDMFPYPSGAGLHVGHPLGFTGTDVYVRYQRMHGRNVLYSMGFDAFGLPAEQYAVQTGQHPAITTAANVATYRRQLRRLGLSHDRRRSVETTDPGYYRWTQWIFARIFDSWYDPDAARPDGGIGRARPIAELRAEFEAGTRTLDDGRRWRDLSPGEQADVIDAERLAYVAEAPVNWCPGLGTVIANEEVTADGRSDRGNYPVFKRTMRQWMMRITAYAERLLDDLDRLDWTDSLKTMQRNWIGRSTGAWVDFQSPARADHRVHDPSRHAVRGHVHGARAGAPARRRPDDVRARPDRRRVQAAGRVAQGRRPPGREPGQDRRVHRRRTPPTR